MQNSFLPKFAHHLFSGCLFSLALSLPAMARGWDDFAPQEPSLKQSGHWEWAWDGDDGVTAESQIRSVPGSGWR